MTEKKEDYLEFIHKEAIASCKILIAILEANMLHMKAFNKNHFAAGPPHGALIIIDENVNEIFDIQGWLKENDERRKIRSAICRSSCRV